MRVIAGAWKGMPLHAPRGTAARPTTDRVKESMFNLLGPHWSGRTAVDLFAGSGALGLEALSRGAESAIFVDPNPLSVQAILANIRRCKAEAQTQVWRMDWQTAWARVCAEAVDVGWVFVDPPYAKQLWLPVLETVAKGTVPVLHGVVCEHPRTVSLPERVGPLERGKHRSYGDIAVSIYYDERENAGDER
ncbi:16S rRNA (guanine(966)-N(2))-methyltransferase RsmD [Alicyclobacillus contaminans]|uniref:16S rRNA (guanine(966)-N(2))-methyltransferase RsmD n=1 Tax=Alicyclobacillus contaminans TaxID=392016 RepID=UPI00047BBBDA|nr:16S rRNA (guanine(966)-N(2))-methyltransferase RsmD [Alicyclobacillus contaminans]